MHINTQFRFFQFSAESPGPVLPDVESAIARSPAPTTSYAASWAPQARASFSGLSVDQLSPRPQWSLVSSVCQAGYAGLRAR